MASIFDRGFFNSLAPHKPQPTQTLLSRHDTNRNAKSIISASYFFLEYFMSIWRL